MKGKFSKFYQFTSVNNGEFYKKISEKKLLEIHFSTFNADEFGGACRSTANWCICIIISGNEDNYGVPFNELSSKSFFNLCYIKSPFLASVLAR